MQPRCYFSPPVPKTTTKTSPKWVSLKWIPWLWRFDHGEWWNSDGDHESYDEHERFTFNSDGTYLFLEDSWKETGTYWITNDKKLIRSYDEDGEYYNETSTIERLTKTELIILFEEDYDYYYEWRKCRVYYKKIN